MGSNVRVSEKWREIASKRFEVYFCPVCGRTITWEVNATMTIDHSCGHRCIDGVYRVYDMIKIWPVR